jgi:RNA polymerase sigma-70 factor (ECF subfamily)
MELGKSSQPRDELATASQVPEQRPPTGKPRLRIVPPDDGIDAVSIDALPPDIVPDDALIAALVAGETEALGALYDRHARVVFSLLLRIIGDRDGAEELLQEVFFRAWQRADAFDETRGTVRGWLYGIAHNLALNELRRRRRRPQVQERLASDDSDTGDFARRIEAGSDPAGDAWSAVRDAELAHALDQLPSGQRAVLLLYAEGFSQSEIAEKLGVPLGTVKSRMRRALYHLRDALSSLGTNAGWQSD